MDYISDFNKYLNIRKNQIKLLETIDKKDIQIFCEKISNSEWYLEDITYNNYIIYCLKLFDINFIIIRNYNLEQCFIMPLYNIYEMYSKYFLLNKYKIIKNNIVYSKINYLESLLSHFILKSDSIDIPLAEYNLDEYYYIICTNGEQIILLNFYYADDIYILDINDFSINIEELTISDYILIDEEKQLIKQFMEENQLDFLRDIPPK